MSDTTKPDSLRQHSARTEWKTILGMALATMAIAFGMLFFLENKNYIIKFWKFIEFQTLPLLIVGIALGIVWSIRATFGIRRCTDEIPMEENEYSLFQSIYGDNAFLIDRITRYSYAMILVAVAAGLSASSGAPDTIKISLATVWFPGLLYIGAGIFAFELLFLGIVLALAGLIIWGITSLPTSMAIIFGAIIIAYAIYAHKK